MGIFRDLGRTAYHGAAHMRAFYREQRRLAGESVEFREAFPLIDSIPGWLSREDAEALYELARSVRPSEAIVEIGSYLGRSTAALALGAPAGGKVYSVDPHTGDRSQVEAGLEGINTHSQMVRNMERLRIDDRVQPLVTTSARAATAWNAEKVGLLFIDGWHSADAVFDDGTKWAPHLIPESVIVFDDLKEPEVAAGISRLVAEGVISDVRLRVGKLGIAGPVNRFPSRLYEIAT